MGGFNILTRVAQNAMIDYLANTPINGGAGSLIHLMKADVLNTPDTVLGDLEEADFPGYAATGPQNSFDRGINPETGNPMLYIDSEASWVCTGYAGTPQPIYGWYMVNDGGELIYVHRFDNPKVVNAEGFVIQVFFQVLFENRFTF